MDKYGMGSTPKLKSPGDNYYYNGASSYQAIEIDSVNADVMGELNSFEGEVTQSLNNFKKKLSEMAEEFGKNFITINDHELGFVDVEAFEALISKLNEAISTSKTDSESFFSTCASEIKAINSWLSQLETNYSNYSSASTTYNNNIGIKDRDAQLVAAQAKSVMNQYKKLSGVPTDYGDWIRK